MSGTEPEKPTWIADVRADEPTIKALLDILKLKTKVPTQWVRADLKVRTTP